VVNSSQGGGSKDTWVLADGNTREVMLSRVADHLLDEPLRRAGRERGALHRREPQLAWTRPPATRTASSGPRWPPPATTSLRGALRLATRAVGAALPALRREYGNSIISCLRAARENARAVREIISSEMWEQLNRAYLMVTEAARRADRWSAAPHAFSTP
jgi:hypothetical protein